MALSVDYSSSPRIITILAPVTSIRLQDLYDQICTLDDTLSALGFDWLADAEGKQDIGDGNAVGITLTLRDAKLAFEARPGPTWEQCIVNGGNLVAVDALGVTFASAIQGTPYVNVNTQASSSPTISSLSAAQIWDANVTDFVAAGTMGEVMRILQLINMNRMKINSTTKKLEVYEADGTTVAYRFDLKDLTGAPADSGATERTNRTAGP